jgi:2-polyprenyl-3-methyl-5-hydroxy-6-metoxy-1,4-benzoquinol methylase
MSMNDRARWNERYAHDDERREASRVVTDLEAWIPRAGRALDLAGGSGRHAIWLAQRGLEVTLVDVSDVALGIAREHARAANVTIAAEQRDLETEGLPKGPWDLILCVHYLQRSLFDRFADALAPHGRLVFVQPTKRNLERHAKPSERFLLGEGELPTLVRGLALLHYEEGWVVEGRHEARLVAERT